MLVPFIVMGSQQQVKWRKIERGRQMILRPDHRQTGRENRNAALNSRIGLQHWDCGCPLHDYMLESKTLTQWTWLLKVWLAPLASDTTCLINHGHRCQRSKQEVPNQAGPNRLSIFRHCEEASTSVFGEVTMRCNTQALPTSVGGTGHGDGTYWSEGVRLAATDSGVWGWGPSSSLWGAGGTGQAAYSRSASSWARVGSVSQVRAGGNGSRQISLRPEWSNRCDWSGSIHSESEIRKQLSIRVFSSCDPLHVALGTEQTLTWGRWRRPPPQPLMVANQTCLWPPAAPSTG